MTNDGRMMALADQLAAGRMDAGSLGPLIPGSDEALYRLEVAGAAAVSTWQQVRELVNATGCCPVIMGSEEDVKHWRGEVTWEWGPSDTMRDMTTPVAAMLEESGAIEPPAWLRARAARDPEYYEPPHGAWPKNARRID